MPKALRRPRSGGGRARVDRRTKDLVRRAQPGEVAVILHEDHTTPIVGVHVQYDVGSKNEKEGRTGFAHLFEHLMFQGT